MLAIRTRVGSSFVVESKLRLEDMVVQDKKPARRSVSWLRVEDVEGG